MSLVADPVRGHSRSTAQRGLGHKDAADSVRALAAVTVVASHAIQIIWYPYVGLGNWTHRANSFVSDTAVIVFFVLSGYFISASIHANLLRHGRFHAFEYVRSRAIRIYPPLVFAMVISGSIVAVIWLGGWPGIGSRLAFSGDLYTAREAISITIDDFLNAILMRNGLLIINGPLWSLYCEVKLYVLAGLICFCAFGTAPLFLRLVIAGVIISLAQIWSFGFMAEHLVYCAWWAMGASLFVSGQSRDLSRRWRALGPLLAAGLVLWLSPMRVDLEVGRVVFVLLLSHAMFFRWSWSEPITKSIAGYSYTLYLIHFPIMILAYSALVEMIGQDEPPVALRLLAMGLGIGVSFFGAAHIAAFAENPARVRHALSCLVRRAKQGL